MKLQTLDFRKLFESLPGLSVILSPDLDILAATNGYLKALLTTREEITGRSLIDIFYHKSASTISNSANQLLASLKRVLIYKMPDVIPAQQYDIALHDGSNHKEKYWRFFNVPVLDDQQEVEYIIHHVEDVTELKISKRTAYQVYSRYNKMINEIQDYAILLMDVHGHLENWNAGAQRIKGYKAEEVIGKHFRLFYTTQDIALHKPEQLIRLAINEGRAYEEAFQVRKDGSAFWASVTITAIHNEQGTIIGFSKITRDLTEKKETEEALKAGNEELLAINEEIKAKADELERSNNFKNEFLSNVSHELRTPLNSMLILSRLLAENRAENLTGKQVEQATIINKAGNDLLVLINDILDLGKIEAGKMETVLEDTRIAEIGQNMELLFTPIAAQREISFIIQMEDPLPEYIITDGIRCEQILKNLLANAFKFTPKGGVVTLNISSADNQTQLTFAISDTGIGIPPAKQAYIFEAFRQADGSTNRQYGGTGLGLSISKQLTGLLGGEIQLQSEEGKGSTFTLYLPFTPGIIHFPNKNKAGYLEADNANPPSPRSIIKPGSIPAAPPAGLKALMEQKTILVTDDDERNIVALQMILEDYKPNLLIASNGKEAIQVLNEHGSVDLVLMDIMMPVMDGFEAMQVIRQHEHLKHLPIIALTAKAMKSELEECIQAGASDYLSKPIDVQNLLGSIETWLKKSNPNDPAVYN